MLTPQEFIAYLDRGFIPNDPPITKRFCVDDWKARDEVTKRGMWALVYNSWVKELVYWIDNRKVLEVMAGRGWLAKALFEKGVDITATDDNSWDDKHNKAVAVYPVILMDAIKAIRKFGADCEIIIMSWPPYSSEIATEVLKAWGQDKPVVYIGEGYGGCNAPDSFWQHWKECSEPQIPLAQWYGLHDCIQIGYYTNPHHVCTKCGEWSYDGDLCWRCE